MKQTMVVEDVRTMIRALEAIRVQIVQLKEQAQREGRTAAAYNYAQARGGVSRAIRPLVKIRDYAPRD